MRQNYVTLLANEKEKKKEVSKIKNARFKAPINYIISKPPRCPCRCYWTDKSPRPDINNMPIIGPDL